MKVLKFGGTSVGSVESVRQIQQIVAGQTEDCIVVVSALGGITDRLIKISQMAAKGDAAYNEEFQGFLDGKAQQPLFIKHGNFYVDYSHGIRMIYRTVKVDGKEMDAREILESPQLYRLLSDEPMYLKKASYEGMPRYR